MFGSDAAAAAEELNSGLQWLEGELAKSEGPLFLGKDLSLVSTGGAAAAAAAAAAGGVCLQQERVNAAGDAVCVSGCSSRVLASLASEYACSRRG
jgi:hypothetical protein